MTGAADRLSKLLTDAGYRPLATPLKIGGLEFDVSAAFVGSSPLPDLILVVDTALGDEQRIVKMIEGVARAMDVVGSKRPLTTVVSGPRPNLECIDAMSRVSRVLPVDVAAECDPEMTLRNWLAVLLPLDLPEEPGGIADPLAEIGERLTGLSAEVKTLIASAHHGPHAVEQRLYELLADALRHFLPEEDS